MANGILECIFSLQWHLLDNNAINNIIEIIINLIPYERLEFKMLPNR